MTLVLDAEELVAITGKKQKKAQLRHLQRMGIPVASVRADGSPVVRRSDFETARKLAGPDFGALQS